MPNKIKNTVQSWSSFSISLHWLVALLVIGLYPLGWYMVELDYYDEWYRTAPHWHKSFGIALFGILVIRILNRLLNSAPDALSSHQAWEVKAAKATHVLLYLLLLVSCVSGYLISTADGRGISFFDLFDVPALPTVLFEQQEDIAGEIHEWATNLLIVLSGLHAVAAIKHHLVDRDDTLRRMLGKSTI